MKLSKDLKHIKKKAEAMIVKRNLLERKINRVNKELSLLQDSCPHPEEYVDSKLSGVNTMFSEEPYITDFCHVCGRKMWRNF